MAHKKAGGSAKNLSYQNPQYIGIKLSGGQKAKIGDIILTQRGSKYLSGKNTSMGKNFSIYALKEGVVQYDNKRKIRFDGQKVIKKRVSVK